MPPMRVIARHTLIEFGEVNPQAKAALDRWYTVVKSARWTTMQEASAAFSKAKAINADRIRYEISGGAFRLICAIDFRRQVIFVKFLGTHAEYDAVDAATVAQY
jgi:mRNA interferase HigB